MYGCSGLLRVIVLLAKVFWLIGARRPRPAIVRRELGLERLSNEAMERIRKNSEYTGEKARRDELDNIVSEWAERVL